MILAQAAFPDWAWLSNPRTHDRLGAMLMEHLELTILAVLIGLLLAAPLALAAFRWPRLKTPILGFTAILYTVPSLALFMLLIGFFGTGLTRTTALVGLVIYSLIVLVRNLVAGLEGVPDDVREAAQATGHTRLQRLLRVELPVALPVVLAGVRIATVSAIGLVTITAFIGFGGFGQLFLTGFARLNATIVLTGLVASGLLALVLDAGIWVAERLLLPWTRRG